ncbi:hypothetical protein ACFL0O_09220, partial [Thermodesulfobacteriota bacterium]
MKDRFIKPTTSAAGPGTRASFTRWDVYGVALFKSLVEFGFARKLTAEYVNHFIRYEKDDENPHADFIQFRIQDNQISTMLITAGPWVMEVKTGITVSKYTPKLGLDFISPAQLANENINFEDWDHIHFV